MAAFYKTHNIFINYLRCCKVLSSGGSKEERLLASGFGFGAGKWPRFSASSKVLNVYLRGCINSQIKQLDIYLFCPCPQPEGGNLDRPHQGKVL